MPERFSQSSAYLVPSLKGPRWSLLLHECLTLADSYELHLPQWAEDNEVRLAESEFRQLPEASCGSCPQHEGCTRIGGLLGTGARELLTRVGPPSDPKPGQLRLWGLSLFREGELVLSIEDFDVVLLFMRQRLPVDVFENLGGSSFEQVFLKPQPGIEVMEIEANELTGLVSEIEHRGKAKSRFIDERSGDTPDSADTE